MTRLRCPSCADDLNLEIAIPPGRSATVTCSHCAHVFKANSEGVIPPAAVAAVVPPAARPAPIASPPATAAVSAGDPFRWGDAPSNSGVRPTAQRSEAGEPEPRRRASEDEEAEKPTVPPNRTKRTALIAGVGGAVSLLVGLGIGLLVFGGGKGTATGVKPQPRGGDIARNAPAGKPSDKTDKPQPGGDKKDRTEKPDKPEAELAGALLDRQELAGDAVYDRMIRGCVFVVASDSQGKVLWTGTGWVADTEKKIVVTAHHVIEGVDSITLHFPHFNQAGRPITSLEEYLGPMLNGKYEKKGIPAALVKPDEGRTKDLALLQVQGDMPPKTRPIPLAASGTKAGQQVYSVGSSGALKSGIIWRFVPGTVSTDPLFLKRNKYSAFMCEIKAQNNPGDSGGPFVNSRVELVGLVSTGSSVENSIINIIDVREIRALLKSTYDRKGWEWKDQPGTGGGSVPKASMQTWVRQLKTAKRSDEIKEAARRLGELEEDAQVAVPELLDVLLKNPDSQVQEIVFAALEAIKKPAKLDRSLIAQALKSTHILAQTYAVGLLAREKANRDEYIEVLELTKQAHQKILDGKTESTRELSADRELLARTFGAFEQYGLECKEEVIDTLFTALEDTDSGVRRAAAKAVGSFIDATRKNDPKGSPFDKVKDTPRLEKALQNSKSPELRWVAASAYRVMPESVNEAFAFYTVGLLSNEKDPKVLVELVAGLTERWGKDRGIERYRESINKLSDHGYTEVKLAFVKAAGKLPWKKSTNDRLVALVTSSEVEDKVKNEAFNILIQKLDVPTGKSDEERELADEQLQLIIALLSSKERKKQIENLRIALDQHDARKLTQQAKPVNSQEQGRDESALKEQRDLDLRRLIEQLLLDTAEKKQLIDKLAKFGPAAGGVTADLVTLLGTQNSYRVRIAILLALRQIGKEAASAAPAIQNLLTFKRDAKSPFREFNAEALKKFYDSFGTAKPLTPEEAQQAAFDEFYKVVQLEAVATLVSFGKDAVRQLSAVLEEQSADESVVLAVIAALRDIGPDAQDEAIPRLFALVLTSAKLRPEIAKAVAAIGGEDAAKWLMERGIWTRNGAKLNNLDIRKWAYFVMGEIDLRTINSDELVTAIKKRLELVVDRDPDVTCKEVARLSLAKQKKAIDELKKKPLDSTLDGKNKK